jgi:hypothetical protein
MIQVNSTSSVLDKMNALSDLGDMVPPGLSVVERTYIVDVGRECVEFDPQVIA